MAKLKHVSLRLDPDTHGKFLDETISRFYPAVKNVSQAGQLIFDYAIACAFEGSLPFTLESLQEVLGRLCGLRAREGEEESGSQELTAATSRNGGERSSREGVTGARRLYSATVSRPPSRAATVADAAWYTSSAVALGARVA